MLYNISIKPSTFKTKIWVEMHNDSNEVYVSCSQIKFETTTIRSSLCDYSDVYILVNILETITVLKHSRRK